ncbi:MAG: undecaprenyl-diphosphate phosphatase [Clostridiales bacterium]|jgi:undecaprenyl-diphosphatase|nr:undecaprenyl-diphosphate phosphatase [Clostridiales bacterium]
MSVLEAVILGIIQGFSEFLPISSSGHLVLFQKLFGITESSMAFDILLHVATLIPVIIVYRDIISGLIKKPFQKLTYLLVAGTIPAVIVALIGGGFIDSLFQTGGSLAIGFIITGFLLMATDNIKGGYKKQEGITYVDAILVGCIQAVATVPAISRSGSTIFGSVTRKLDRATAAKFSFLLSIPAIAGATVLELKKFIAGGETFAIDMLPMVFGFISAMLSGYLAINFMLKLIMDAKLKYFAYYVWLIALFIIIGQSPVPTFLK